MSLRDVFIVKEESAENRAAHSDALEKTGFWGKQAAGCLFYAEDTGRLLFSKRSKDVLEPHTYGTWGGAMDRGETPEQTVRREVGEEAGARAGKLIPVYTFKHPSGFQYHNFIAVVPSEFDPKLDHETEGFEWVKPPDWPQPLHPGAKELVRSRGFTDALYRLRNER